ELPFQPGRPRLQTGDLEQVEYQLLEALDLLLEHVEGRRRLLRRVPPPADDVDRRSDGGQRRAQLVADVGGEAGLPVDAVLQGVDHLVERGDEGGQVGV